MPHLLHYQIPLDGNKDFLKNLSKQKHSIWLSGHLRSALGINITYLDPIKALEYTAAINGITAIPILFVIMRIANEKKILGKRVYNKLSNVLRWITVGSMTSAAVIMFVSFNRSTL
jgi:Mn2+/Fe2+ NRAMP family transporter